MIQVALLRIDTLCMLKDVIGSITRHYFRYMPLLGTPLGSHQRGRISHSIYTVKSFNFVVFVGNDKSCITQRQPGLLQDAVTSTGRNKHGQVRRQFRTIFKKNAVFDKFSNFGADLLFDVIHRKHFLHHHQSLLSHLLPGLLHRGKKSQLKFITQSFSLQKIMYVKKNFECRTASHSGGIFLVTAKSKRKLPFSFAYQSIKTLKEFSSFFRLSTNRQGMFHSLVLYLALPQCNHKIVIPFQRSAAGQSCTFTLWIYRSDRINNQLKTMGKSQLIQRYAYLILCRFTGRNPD